MKVIWCLYERVKNTYSIIIELENKYKKMMSHIRPRFSRQSSTSFTRGVTVRVSLLGEPSFHHMPSCLPFLRLLRCGKQFALVGRSDIHEYRCRHNRPVDVPLPISTETAKKLGLFVVDTFEVTRHTHHPRRTPQSLLFGSG